MRRILIPIFLGCAALTAVASCNEQEAAAAGRDVPASGAEVAPRARPTGYVVDSAFSMDEHLARFRTGLARPAELSGGLRSREALAQAFARALERADTAALFALQVDRAEFAWLLYPSSPLLRPPYRQPPEIAWLLLRQAGDKGLRRILERRAGQPLKTAGVVCPDSGFTEGANHYWRRCDLLVSPAHGDTVRERLFGVIVERHGRYKVMSYENQY
jgi:hypothetical protein